MTIVDQYIVDHRHEMNNRQMSGRLGVSEDFIRIRKARLNRVSREVKVDASISAQDEIYALVQFILQRKSGVLVEIAKRRITDINRRLNY